MLKIILEMTDNNNYSSGMNMKNSNGARDTIENESIHELPHCGLKIIQKEENFCFGTDAVLLTEFSKVRKNDVAVDLGTGTGIIPILKSVRSKCSNFTGVEIQEYEAHLAERNVHLNSLQERIKIIKGDLRKINQLLPANSATVVICNPPYYSDSEGEKNASKAKASSRHESLCTLSDVAKAASYLLNSNGRFFMIHRPQRLSEIFSSLKEFSLEPKRIKFVQAFKDREPNLVLIEAHKNAPCSLRFDPSLTVYEKAGVYTEEMKKVYDYVFAGEFYEGK